MWVRWRKQAVSMDNGISYTDLTIGGLQILVGFNHWLIENHTQIHWSITNHSCIQPLVNCKSYNGFNQRVGNLHATSSFRTSANCCSMSH